MTMTIKTSVGDFMDRITILNIKKENGLNVELELEGYDSQIQKFDAYAFDRYFQILKSINLQLWNLEDRKRKGVERYSKEESDTAFLITQLNDLRHETKKCIDVYFNSKFTEMKSH